MGVDTGPYIGVGALQPSNQSIARPTHRYGEKMGGLESSKLHVVHVPQPLTMPSLESAYMYDTTGTSITLKMYPSYPARVLPLVTYFLPSSSILSSC